MSLTNFFNHCLDVHDMEGKNNNDDDDDNTVFIQSMINILILKTI